MTNPNTWQNEQLAIQVYKSSSSEKARIIPTLDGNWRVEFRFPDLNKVSSEELIFNDLQKAKNYCEVTLHSRRLDGEV
jgi:hypothetical protein